MIDELITLYHEEPFQEKKLSVEEAHRYFSHMFSSECMAIASRNGLVVGYVEYWRISFDLFGRLLCNVPINIYDEDIANGEVCYLSDIYIKPEWRGKDIIKELKYKFFSENIQCRYFVGEAKRKAAGLVKTFSRQEAYKKWARQLTMNGVN